MSGSRSCRAAFDAGDTQRELGGDVDHIGPELAEVVHHVAEPGKGPLDIGIEEERNAGRAVHLGPIRRRPVGAHSVAE